MATSLCPVASAVITLGSIAGCQGPKPSSTTPPDSGAVQAGAPQRFTAKAADPNDHACGSKDLTVKFYDARHSPFS